MKKLLSLFVFLCGAGMFTPSLSIAQTTTPTEAPATIATPKVRIGLNAGTMMMSFGRRQSGFAAYFHPTVSYQWRPRIQFHAGVLYMNYSLPGFGMRNERQCTNNGSTYLFTAGATAALTDRLSVYGTMYYDMGQQTMGCYNPSTGFDSRRLGLMMSAEYKISESVRIQTTIRMSNGANPYNYGMWNQFGGMPAQMPIGTQHPIHQRGASW